MTYYIPILVYLAATVAYQSVAKRVSGNVNPFALLTVVYLVASVMCVVALYATKRDQSAFGAIRSLPWSAIVLGISVVGLEASMIYAYRLGWQVSVFPMITYVISIAALLFVGALLFSEAITIKKLVGVAVCIAGIFIMQS